MKYAFQRGAAAIELALLLPWLLLMIDGIAEFGVLMYNQSVLVSAAHLAARAGVAGGPNKRSNVEVAQLAVDEATAHLMLIAHNTTVTVQVNQATSPVFQLPLSVTVNYTYQGLMIGGFLSVLQQQAHMQATAVMYNE